MLQQALRTYLLSKAAITTIVAQRIHVGDFVPANKTDIPAIGIEQVPTPRTQQLDGEECDLQFPVFEIVSKALLYTSSGALCTLVRRALHSLRLGGTVVITVDGAPQNVVIEQVDVLGDWQDDEEDYGHGFTIKPWVLKIRVGWRENVTAF